MSKVKISVVFYSLILTLLAGCDYPTNSATPTATYPYGPPPTPTPTSIYSFAEEGDDPVVADNLGDLAIATPPGPNFWLLSIELLQCNSSDYLVMKVHNTGGVSFDYSLITAYGAPEDWKSSNYSFHHNPNECPVNPGFSLLAPGKPAYLYLKLKKNSPVDIFKIVVRLCTPHPDIQDTCITREIPFELGAIFGPANITLIEEGLCLIGPGPMYEVVRTMKVGEVVELVARSQVEGYLVVQDTKYGVFCYLKDSGIDIPEGLDLSVLPQITPPPLPTATPTVTPTPRTQTQPRVLTPSPTPVPPPK